MGDREGTVSPREAFEQLRERYLGLEAGEAGLPNRRVEDRVLDGQRLAGVGRDDRDLFVKLAGSELFDLHDLDLLETAALGLRYAEGRWQAVFDPSQDPQIARDLELAVELRAAMLRDLDYVAERFAPDGLAGALHRLRGGDGQADLLQDLVTGATLCETHEDRLRAIAADPELPGKAAALSASIGERIERGHKEMKQALDLRNRAFWVHERMYREVREGGKFIFRNVPDRRQEYTITRPTGSPGRGSAAATGTTAATPGQDTTAAQPADPTTE